MVVVGFDLGAGAAGTRSKCRDLEPAIMKACREDGVGRGTQAARRNGAVSQPGRSQSGFGDGEAGSSAADARSDRAHKNFMLRSVEPVNGSIRITASRFHVCMRDGVGIRRTTQHFEVCGITLNSHMTVGGHIVLDHRVVGTDSGSASCLSRRSDDQQAKTVADAEAGGDEGPVVGDLGLGHGGEGGGGQGDQEDGQDGKGVQRARGA